MCYADFDERCEIWRERTVRARKVHTCELCLLPILVRADHVRIVSMFEGDWRDIRLHPDCLALAKRVQLEVCNQDGYGIERGDLRNLVREHMGEAPSVLREYREVLRARRSEGVWPPARAAA